MDFMTMDQIIKAAPAVAAAKASPRVSDRYVFVPTAPVIEELMSRDWMPVDARQSRTKDDPLYAFHVVRFRERHGTWGDAAKGDDVFEIVLCNAHNGRAALRLLAGVFVTVCGNGLVVCEQDIGAYVGVHLRGVKQMIDDAMRSWPAMVGGISRRIEGAKRIRLPRESQLALASKIRGEIWPAGGPSVDDLVQRRRPDDASLWSTFNVIQENVCVGGIPVFAPRRRRIMTRGVKSARRYMDSNRKMWGVFSDAHDWIERERSTDLVKWAAV